MSYVGTSTRNAAEMAYIPPCIRVTHRLSTITTRLPGLASVTSQGHAGLMSSRNLRVCRYDLSYSSGWDATLSRRRHCTRVSDVLRHRPRWPYAQVEGNALLDRFEGVPSGF